MEATKTTKCPTITETWVLSKQNDMGKGEIAFFEQFLFSPQCF